MSPSRLQTLSLSSRRHADEQYLARYYSELTSHYKIVINSTIPSTLYLCYYGVRSTEYLIVDNIVIYW